MTIDLKLACVLFSISFVLLVWAGILMCRPLVFREAARGLHDFHVIAVGTEPQCATCPFNRHCPYSKGVACHFAQKPSAIIHARSIL